MVFKLLKCKISFIIIFFVHFVSFSQNQISGKITSSQKDVLSFANVMVYDENETKLLAYAISDDNGKYQLELPNGIFIFKVSYLGYKPVSLKKNITKSEIINFTLQEDVASLKEVVIKAKSLDAIVKNDTIKYNIKHLTNGNEENLKEVLKKLPGVEIDENGKIKANGKTIDKLLINGKEFFGDQHQLATENISAEMVKGISLLQNYSEFSDIDNQDNANKTAMNIEIDKDYKGKIKGNFLLGGGYNSKYEVNANLYSFKNKTNLFFIASSNNIANQTLSIQDYINFQGGINKFLSDNSNTATISGDDLPSYLFAKNNNKEKNEHFSALNFSYNPSKKFKLNSYIIFDKSEISDELFTKQTYFLNNQDVTYNLTNVSEKKLFINNSFIDAIYKPSNKSIFEYTLSISPQNNQFTGNDNFTTQYYKTSKENNNLTLSHLFNLKRIIKKNLLSISLFQSSNNKDENMSIKSNDEFLNLSFINDNFSAEQTTENSQSNIGINTYLQRKVNNQLSIRAKYNAVYTEKSFKSNTHNSYFSNDIEYNVYQNVVGFDLFNHTNQFIYFKLGTNYSFLKINKKYDETYLLPNLKVKFNFKKTHNLSLTYNRNIKLPKVNNFVTESYIGNYNTIFDNLDVKPNTITLNNNYGLNYFMYDLFSGTLISLGSYYITSKNLITKNTIYHTEYNTNYFTTTNDDNKFNSYFLFDKKFSKIPYNLRFKSTLSLANSHNYIENAPNKYQTQNITGGIQIASNYKKSIFNFEFGYEWQDNQLTSENVSIKEKLKQNKIFLNIYFTYKNLYLSIDNSIMEYNSTNFEQSFVTISPYLKYKSKNKKWLFYVKANDLLNFNNNYIIENSVFDNYLEERKTATIGGYIIGGLKYKF